MSDQSKATAMRRYAVLASVALILLVGAQSELDAQATQPSSAASPDLNLAAAGILSWQPADGSYVGAPYLDKGLGGITPGYLVGVNCVVGQRITFATELSNTRELRVEQHGRLVSGDGVGRLRDRLFSVLAGYSARPFPSTRLSILAGVGLGRGVPTLDGIPIDQLSEGQDDPAVREGDRKVALALGLDAIRRVSPRIGVVGNVRVFQIGRSRRAAELGVGETVVRFGAGVQIRLTQ
jgi:hypothetical protein